MIEFKKEWKGDWFNAVELGYLLFNKRLEDHTVYNPELTKDREYFFFKDEIDKTKKRYEEEEHKKRSENLPEEDVFLLSIVLAKCQLNLVRNTSNSLRFIRGQV